MKKLYFLSVLFVFLGMHHAWPQTTIYLQPGPEGKDALVSDFYTWSYPDYPNLFAMAGTNQGTPFVCRSLIEFDLSSIPPDQYLVDARLSLFYANNPSNPHQHYGDNLGLLQRVTEPWEEATVTWWNQPGATDQDEVVLPVSTSGTQDYLDIDVLPLIEFMYNNPDSNFGMLFRLGTEVLYRRLMFASGDYMVDPEKRPILAVTYIDCEPPTAFFEYEAAGLTVSFAGVSPTALTWNWDFGDGNTSNLQMPEHTYTADGFYEVCLMITDSCYFAEYCEVIEVCTGPPAPAFTWSAESLTVSFENLTTAAGGYTWDFGDGETSTLPNPTHTYENPGEYMVCLTAWNSCGEDSTCTLIDICASPNVNFYWDYWGGLDVQFWEYCMMAEQFIWDFGDGHTSNFSNPMHLYAEPGEYLVCLTAINGCDSSTLCDWIYLYEVGISEQDGAPFIIYPNPVRDRLTIGSQQSAVVGYQPVERFSIFDLYGRLMLGDESVNMLPVTVDVSGMPPGMYVVRLYRDDGSASAVKFVKID